MHEHLKIAYDALVKMEGVPEVPPPPAPGHHDSKQYPELDCQIQVLAQVPTAEPAAGLSGVSAESPAATVEQEEKTDVDQQPEEPDWGDKGDQMDGVKDREKAEKEDSGDESEFDESQRFGMSCKQQLRYMA